MKVHVKKLAAVLVAGVLGLGSVVALAAEDAAGVLKYAKESTKSAGEALEHLKAGHKDQAAEALKATRQHLKEVTGDYIGMLLQRANGRVKEAAKLTDSGDIAAATAKMEEAMGVLKDIEAKVVAQMNK